MKKITIRKISDKRAEQEITKLFKYNLSKGVTKVDVLDISSNLKIPGTQVEKIFYQFIKEGKVKQV